jgi:glycosyltransferase involved in cell wall biosynthesis
LISSSCAYCRALGDPDALAAALARLLSDPDLRRALSRRALDQSKRRFSPDALVDCLRETYTSLAPSA